MNNLLQEQDITAVQDIIMRELDVRREQVTPEANLTADLGMDSLGLIEIGMALEEHFDMTIPDEQMERIETVGDIYEQLAEILQRQAPGS